MQLPTNIAIRNPTACIESAAGDRRRYVRACSSCVSCLVSAALAGAALMFVLSYLSYQRLTEEQEISQIEFRRINPEEFQARLMIPG